MTIEATFIPDGHKLSPRIATPMIMRGHFDAADITNEVRKLSGQPTYELPADRYTLPSSPFYNISEELDVYPNGNAIMTTYITDDDGSRRPIKVDYLSETCKVPSIEKPSVFNETENRHEDAAVVYSALRWKSGRSPETVTLIDVNNSH
jgi:hypothetical protein